MKSKTLKIVSFIICAAFLAPGWASATTNDANNIVNKIRNGEGIPAAAVVDSLRGYLPLGRKVERRVSLQAGRVYTFVMAGCDDMGEIDFTILDDDYHVLAKKGFVGKRGFGGGTVISFKPTYSGLHRLTFLMEESTPDGAHYAIQICE
ncbi:MAG: hypothetical protein ACI8UO_002180 [Verrucomicrobiales bacterium]|jgi:hypothetical protein